MEEVELQAIEAAIIAKQDREEDTRAWDRVQGGWEIVKHHELYHCKESLLVLSTFAVGVASGVIGVASGVGVSSGVIGVASGVIGEVT